MTRVVFAFRLSAIRFFIFESIFCAGKEVGEEEPQRVLISNKLVNTEKLLNDLRFWIEVDR